MMKDFSEHPRAGLERVLAIRLMQAREMMSPNRPEYKPLHLSEEAVAAVKKAAAVTGIPVDATLQKVDIIAAPKPTSEELLAPRQRPLTALDFRAPINRAERRLKKSMDRKDRR